MYCINCGKEITDEDKEFCSNCKNPIVQNKETQCGKKWIEALILNWLLGFCGAHRFYTGYIGIGIFQMLTFGGLGIWSTVDMIAIGIDKYKNSKGEKLEGYDRWIGYIGIAYSIMIILLIILILLAFAAFYFALQILSHPLDFLVRPFAIH